MIFLENYIKEFLKEECWPERIKMPLGSQEDIKQSLEYFYRMHIYYESDYAYYKSVGEDINRVDFGRLEKRKNPPFRKEIGNIGGNTVFRFSGGFIGEEAFIFVVDSEDNPLTYVSLSPFREGLCVGNVRHLSGSGYYVTDVYASIAKDCDVLYSDVKQTEGGEGIWQAMMKFSGKLGLEVFEPCEENDCRWMCREV
jgi:hypothetical protein